MAGYVEAAATRAERSRARASKRSHKRSDGWKHSAEWWWLVAGGIAIALVGIGLLSIVADARLSAQRDSILQQTITLESELQQSHETVDGLRGEVAQLRSGIAALDEQLSSTEGLLP